MSAVRRTNQRAETRSHASLPYARPQPRKSSWSLTSWLSYLNPLRIKSPNDDYPEETDEDGPSVYGSEQEQDRSPSPELARAAQMLSERGTQMGVDLASIPPRQRIPLSSHAMPPSIPPPPPPMRSAPVPSTTGLFSIPESSSPATNLRTVSSYLNDRAGQPLSPVEVAGLISLIQKSTPAEKAEPFRFTTSSAPLPSRDEDDSPTGNGNVFAQSGASEASTAPKKMLTRNPNGVYRWQGAGSAKVGPSRNRYSSPAFGPTRSSERLIIKDTIPTEPQRTDNKRRRVGETSASTSSPNGNLLNGTGHDSLSVRSSAPEPSPGRVNFANSVPLAQPIPTTPTRASSGSALRPRVSVPPKPTTPAIPSPLRQAWTGNSPKSDKSDTSPPPARPTKAANLMAELIKEATPPQKVDVSNPYQTANPYGKVPTKPKPKRPRPVRQPPAAKEAEEDSGKEGENDEGKTEVAETAQKKKEPSVEKEYSPQAIIEATVPKGSKRSRPPAHLTKSDAPPAGTEPKQSDNSPEVEEEENRSAKKTRTSPEISRIPGSASSSSPTLKPIPVPTPSSKPSSEDLTTTQASKPESKPEPAPAPEPKGFFFNPEPKPEPAPAPEPKGFSFNPPSANGSAAPYTSSGGLTSPTKVGNRPTLPSFKAPTAPKEPSKLRYVFQPELDGSGATTPEPVESTEPTPVVPATPPVTADTATAPALPVTAKATPLDPRETALALPRSSLPAFAFTLPTVAVPSASSHVLAREQVRALAKTSLPSFESSFQSKAKDNASASSSGSSAPTTAPTTGFNWAAAGMKPASARSGGSWTCSTCMLSNPATATEKCTVCDAPKPGSKPESKSNGGFNWNAPGMKPPSAPTGDNWTCSTCMLSNPATATEKCTVCEAPKPNSKPAATTSNGGFNWAPAGVKAPSAPMGGNWTCSTCMLSNPPTAKDRCTVCDAPR